MHAGGVLEPAQALRLVRNDALRLLLVVRLAGKHFAAHGVVVRPFQVYAGVKPHIFEVVAHAARVVVVKYAVLGIHHNVGVVKPRRSGDRHCRRAGFHDLVPIQVRIGNCRRVHRGISQHRHGNLGGRVVGDREVAVEHVAGGGLKRGGQIAGRRRREQVLPLGHVQQVRVAGRAGHHGGRGLHGPHVRGPVLLCQDAAVLC